MSWNTRLRAVERKAGAGVQNTTAVTAAGSAQGSAAALSEGVNIVDGADGTKGVILPPAYPGKGVIVINNVSANLKVYPNTDDKINDGSANAALTMGNLTSAAFHAEDEVDWYTVPRVPS